MSIVRPSAVGLPGVAIFLLRQAFGIAYDDYARDVKRFVPGLF